MLKLIFRSLGLEVRKRNFKSSEALRLASMMSSLGINVVVDVGAHVGRYRDLLRSGGYQGRIISIEPLESAHSRLLERALCDPQWTVFRRCAVADSSGGIDLRVSADEVSSSVMELSVTGEAMAPSASLSRVVRVPSITIEQLLAEVCGESSRCWLKLDVQGLEVELLSGTVLGQSRLVAVQAEASLVELYRGQGMFLDLLALLRTQGFAIWGLLPGFSVRSSGRMLQVDVVAVREAVE